MFRCLQKIVLLSICFAVNVHALNISNGTFGVTLKPPADLAGPSITDFISAPELVALRNLVPQEQVEWINATNPWSSNRRSQESDSQTRDIDGRLSRRYVDYTKCSNAQRRIILRNQLHAVMHMLLDAQTNLNLSHPVWRSLITGAFQDEPRALERMKGLFSVLYDTINDPQYTIVLNCNVAAPQCLQTRNAPENGRQQVPAAYFNIDDNLVNMCNGYFGMPHLERMECKEGTPMSYYASAGKSFLL